MTFNPEFNAIAAMYFGVSEMHAEHGHAMVTYEDGTTHDIGELSEYPMLLDISGLTITVENKQLVVTTAGEESPIIPEGE